jgi:hypothetical protein
MPRAFILITKQMLYFDRYAKVLAPRLNIFRDPRITTALATDAFTAGLLAPQQPRSNLRCLSKKATDRVIESSRSAPTKPCSAPR